MPEMPMQFRPKTSLTRKLVLATMGVSVLLLMESLSMFFSSRSQVENIVRVQQNSKLVSKTKQARQLVQVLKDLVNAKEAAAMGSMAIVVLNQLPEKIAEISSIRKLSPEEAEYLKDLSGNLEALAKIFDRSARSIAQSQAPDSNNRLIAAQYLAEINDTLSKFDILVLAETDSIFSHLFRDRYFPLVFSGTTALIFIGLALGFGLVAARRLRSSLQDLMLGADRIAGGDFSIRVPLHSTDEIGQVSYSFNKMAEKLQETTVSKALLESANGELEAFSYSVSHDLRAPLRSIDGFSKILIDDYNEKLDDEGRGHLNRVRAATQRMGSLIDDMLGLAKVTRKEVRKDNVDLSELAAKVCEQLQATAPERKVEFKLEPGISAHADPGLMLNVLENLIGNAFKFSGKKPDARIEFGRTQKNEKTVFFVRDNGAGFDMKYSSKLFGTFQRMHSFEEFAGTGIGLATVKRIITRHGGEIWAESEVGQGASFYFWV